MAVATATVMLLWWLKWAVLILLQNVSQQILNENGQLWLRHGGIVFLAAARALVSWKSLCGCSHSHGYALEEVHSVQSELMHVAIRLLVEREQQFCRNRFVSAATATVMLLRLLKWVVLI